MNSDKEITYPGKEAESVIEQAAGAKGKGAFLILAGRNRSAMSDFVSKVEKKTGSLHKVDLREVVSTHEEETYANLDKLFEELAGEDKTILLMNGDVLSGEYTGFTYSTQRYATPQQKYLQKRITESGKVVLLELKDDANVTNSFLRKSMSVIRFPVPQSGFSKLIWKLKQIRVHGHTFENRRPLDVR
ncbi:MAG: hypothetical protein JJU46_08960 [Balneolaceae bacterium]|nr:hypothetical protein [Balneolaceae bacterium]MCH8549491.1 hypothetical protein [Balneolaceae bacterium]